MFKGLRPPAAGPQRLVGQLACRLASSGIHFQLLSSLRSSLTALFEPPDIISTIVGPPGFIFNYFRAPGTYFQLFSSLRTLFSAIFEPPELIFSYLRAPGIHFQLFSSPRSSFSGSVAGFGRSPLEIRPASIKHASVMLGAASCR